MSHILSLQDWTKVYTVESINDKWLTFINTFINHLNNVCPFIEKNAKNSGKRKFKLPYELQHLRTLMKDMYEFYKYTNMDIYKNRYKKLKRQYRQELVNLKSHEYSDQIKQTKNVSKTVWNIVKDNKSKSQRKLPEKKLPKKIA